MQLTFHESLPVPLPKSKDSTFPFGLYVPYSNLPLCWLLSYSAPATLVSLLVVTNQARPACWDASHPSPTHLSQPTPSPLSGLDLPNYPISNCPPHLDPGTLHSIYHLLPYYISDLLIFLSLCLSQLGNELYNGRAFCLVLDREDCFLRFPDSPPPFYS